MNEDRSARYHRLKRRAGVLSTVWSAALLAAVLWSGATLWLRAAAERAAAFMPPAFADAATVAVYVGLLLTLCDAATLVPAWYSGFALERRYGLSNQTLGQWSADRLKGLALGLVLGILAAQVVYGFIRRAPDGWWWPAGLVFALAIVGLANLAPVLFMPLFYSIKPLERAALCSRLLALANRAGASVLGVYEWGLGKQTRKANAALTGLGGTRRILVSDTMLAEYSDDEIEVVLAHELAHHVHGDIWKGILLESALVLAGCYAASRVLPLGVAAFHLRGVADVAGLPILLLTTGALSLLLMPAAHALSRAHERRADRFALRLTNNPGAFVSAMKRLGAQNLAEEQPSRLVQCLFYSHPPVSERIAAARHFAGVDAGPASA